MLSNTDQQHLMQRSPLHCVSANIKSVFHMRSFLLFAVLAKRKGFVKVALETGSNIVPVIFFGENDLFDVSVLFGIILHLIQGKACLSFVE